MSTSMYMEYAMLLTEAFTILLACIINNSYNSTGKCICREGFLYHPIINWYKRRGMILVSCATYSRNAIALGNSQGCFCKNRSQRTYLIEWHFSHKSMTEINNLGPNLKKTAVIMTWPHVPIGKTECTQSNSWALILKCSCNTFNA